MTRVILATESHTAYSPEAVENTITLGYLLDAVTEAIAAHGEDAEIVIHNGQQYGASFGRIDSWAEIFTPANPDGSDA